MSVIWEELSPSFKVTWPEVLDFRKTHICSPEQSVKALRYRHQQRQHQEHTRSYSQGSDPFPGSVRCQQGIPIPATSPVVSVNHSFPPLTTPGSHHHVGLPPAPQYIYPNGCCANNYSTYGPTYNYIPCTQPCMKANSNGYYYTNGFVTPPIPPGYPVPTGQLIEVESHNAGYDTMERRSRKPRKPEHINNDLYKGKNNNEAKYVRNDRETDKEEGEFEDWDYVYRNLESQGYSKDLGERGDLLSPNSQKQSRSGKRLKETNLDEALNNLAVSNRPLKMSEAVKTLEQEKKAVQKPVEAKIERQVTPSSSYENLAPQEMVKKSSTSKNVNYAKTKSLPREKNNVPVSKPAPNKTLDVRKVKEDKSNRNVDTVDGNVGKSALDGWQCKACTFLNGSDKEICEMCSKSRTTTLEQPMEIGGAECSKCTLVNPKNLKACEACGTSLKDSPTYI